jgi:2-polyprenyl-3-methyl-5-hydroxy-6-metoxy-1,4-benzoquinol methylase
MPTAKHTERAQHEIEHGRLLAERDPELIWGWATPAGQLRARRRAGLIADGAGLRPGMHVLEIGCGTGNFTALFAGRGANILAVDISPDLLERAAARGLPPEQVRFDCKRFEDCEVDGPFDAVIGSSILHHLDLETALQRIYELLKPGGVMSFAEPNMLNPQVFAERTLRFLPLFYYVSRDETAFVRWSLRALLEDYGFEHVRITPFDWLHPATPKAVIPVVRGFGGALEALPLLREFAGSLHICAARPSPSTGSGCRRC